MKLRCLIIGEQSLPLQCAGQLLARGHEIVGVVTSSKPFQHWSGKQAIACIDGDSDLTAFARGLEFDCLFSIVNGRILPQELLGMARKHAINFHDGPLPHYAGYNVTSWALLNGETSHGISWHDMGGGIDGGPIYKQVAFAIDPGETAFTLNAKCWDAALASFGPMVDELAAGGLSPVPQDPGRRAYFPRYSRPSCVLDFDRPAETLARLARSMDFASYANPMGIVKFWDGTSLVLISELVTAEQASGRPSGAVVSLQDGTMRVATATADVILRGLRLMDGKPWTPPNPPEPGFELVLPKLDPRTSEKLAELHGAASRHEAHWVRAFANAMPLSWDRDLKRVAPEGPYRSVAISQDLLRRLAGRVGGAARTAIVSAFAAQLSRMSGVSKFELAFQNVAAHEGSAAIPEAFAAHVPLHIETTDHNFEEFRATVERNIARATEHGTFLLDLFFRYPELRSSEIGPQRYAAGVRLGPLESPLPLPGQLLTLVVSPDGRSCSLVYHAGEIGEPEAEVRRDRLAAALEAVTQDPALPLSDLPLMDSRERRRVLEEWNATTARFEDQPIHLFFEQQAALRPDAIAVVFEDREVCYADLNRKANQLAAHLRSLGAGPECVVGIFLDRSIEMVVALLGTLKSGAAYLPLDPTLPASRRDFMLKDTAAALVLTSHDLAVGLGGIARAVCLDTEWPEISRLAADNFDSGVQPENLAYVIYTSGSTGQPKGVSVTHRNVANFFAGMDREIGGSEPGVWLAVTSISFDISVLELFWTLGRGFRIVLAADEHRAMVSRSTSLGAPPADFSLFYFASNRDTAPASEQYRLLFEGARFADTHGFHAVWTPERHFHAFGGLYPNPSVTSAAIAAATSRVKIRAGSVVLPLHNPIRVAEEWSFVDNISNGRVGISFAAGWHARDFVLAPENYADAKNLMFQNIAVVRRLWRGESLDFADGKGVASPISIYPRPVQPELPTWVTAAGNPETFRMAGEGGYNLLTHLLGQKLEDVQAKIQVYREARRSKGLDPKQGRVTLMLHTFVAETREQAREAVRGPMKEYLRSSVDLIKNSPWSFPAFASKPGMDLKSADLSQLSAEEMDALLEFAFERYFETSGLFGTRAQCVEMADTVRRLDVDEIACLVDFGVETELALRNLSLLNEVREACQASAARPDFSLPAQMERHGVTHLQCTPSMAKMLVSSQDSRAGLAKLKKLMVGGEALPAALAGDLAQLVPGGVHNMYGPTETTIWSTTAPIRSSEVTIGLPISNTSIYVLDSALQPVPTGLPGDLYIGGEGVARGYWQRPELTAERFLPNPFRPQDRIYRTGDVAKYAWDGTIEFLGRSDFQVKIRGFRIELGEIEAALNRYPGVRDSVVAARTERETDVTLTGYLVRDPAAALDPGELRVWLKQLLPEYMVPGVFVELDALPLTPNGKIDRKALPAPAAHGVPGQVPAVLLPAGEMEQLIAGIWQEALQLPALGVEDNFFDLGGHSILVVQVNTKLREALKRGISLVDLFRFPTIRSLARHLSGGERPESDRENGAARAQLRRELLGRRLPRRVTLNPGDPVDPSPER